MYMGLLDISGFFTGLIINLLLVTLICYYFKRKYENIEAAQMEQAKLLYDLLKNSNSSEKTTSTSNVKNIELSDEIVSRAQEDFESDYSEETSEEEDDEEEVCIEDNKVEPEHKEVLLEDYNKMSVKSLRDFLTNKGDKTNHKMKKNELIGLLTNKKSLVVDLAFEEEEKEEPELPDISLVD